LINIPSDDKVKAFINVTFIERRGIHQQSLHCDVYEKGQVKKTSLEQYSSPRVNGINAITIREGDTLAWKPNLTTGDSEILNGSEER
jgi:DNA gyrase subunit A